MCSTYFCSSYTKFLTSKKYWNYLCKNIKFQNGTNKICAIIFCGNAPIMIIVIEASFLLTSIHMIDGVGSRPFQEEQNL